VQFRTPDMGGPFGRSKGMPKYIEPPTAGRAAINPRPIDPTASGTLNRYIGRTSPANGDTLCVNIPAARADGQRRRGGGAAISAP
jgi:hypothetical protein